MADWLPKRLRKTCDPIVADREAAVASNARKPQMHLDPSPKGEVQKRNVPQEKQHAFLWEAKKEAGPTGRLRNKIRDS